MGAFDGFDWNAWSGGNQQTDAEGNVISEGVANPFLPSTQRPPLAAPVTQSAPATSGITTLPGAQTTVANPVVQQALAAYTPLKGNELLTTWYNATPQDTYDLSGFTKLTPGKIETAQSKAERILGRPLTQAELYQVGQGYTGSNLTNLVKQIDENQDITNFYQNTYGRAPTLDEFISATSTVNYKNAPDKLLTTLGGTDEAMNAKVFGTNNDISAREIQDFINANQQDPYAIYSAAVKYGVTPEEISTAMRATGKNANNIISSYSNAKTINDAYTTAGLSPTGQDFNQSYKDLQSGKITADQFTRNFYNNQLTNLYNFEAARANVTGDPFTDAAIASAYDPKNISAMYNYTANQSLNNVLGDYAQYYKQDNSQLINDLVSGKITREQYDQQLQNSSLNKYQEAGKIATMMTQLSGGSSQDAVALRDALLGKGGSNVDPEILSRAKEAFNNSLSSESASNTQLGSLIYDAANQEGAKNTDFFKNNPNLLARYTDISDAPVVKFKHAGTGGQYNYFDGLPILKASEIDKMFNHFGTNSLMGNSSDTWDNAVGWDTGSLSGAWKRGSDVLGTNVIESTDENGNVTRDYVGLDKVANLVGIDPNKFTDTYKTVETVDPETGQTIKTQVIDRTADDQLYEAINNATYQGIPVKNLLLARGQTGGGKSGAGEINKDGETRAFSKDADVTGNHAQVMYIRDDKTGSYYPVTNTVQYFNASTELSGGWFSDTFGGLASIPGIAELSLLTPAAPFYPAIKAAQVAALGGDFNDMLKSGAMAYVGQNFLPGITKDISGGLGDLGITNQIANQALTGATVSGGIAGLTGRSIEDAALIGGTGGAIAGGINTLLPEANTAVKNAFNLTDSQAKVFTNTLARLAPTILTGGKVDVTKLLMNMLISGALKGQGGQTGSSSRPSATQVMQELGISEEEFNKLSPEEQANLISEESSLSKYIKQLMDEGTISYDDGAGMLYRNRTLDATTGMEGSNWYEKPNMSEEFDANKIGIDTLRSRLGGGDIRI